MTQRAIASLVLTPAAVALAALLTSASPIAGGDDSQAVRPTVLAGDDLLRIFQEGKDAAEKLDPPENNLGTGFDPLPSPPIPSDYR